MSWYQLLDGVKERTDFDFKGSIINIESNDNLTPSGDVAIEIPSDDLTAVIEAVKGENQENLLKVDGANFKYQRSLINDSETVRNSIWTIPEGENTPGAIVTVILKSKIILLIRTYGENKDNVETAKAHNLLDRIIRNLIDLI
ncbi:DgyrCDS4774 [Dimorphilus gyrociliatus]|uniref:DgyrCDS4774 n=1 Tax=Dimorphilus gyrociliatus TaxID=2664684 RepID=A0A7I8VJE6_9ANNE|nr:DgyrCDS4774 [Dimorphilus gyrociliatus]